MEMLSVKGVNFRMDGILPESSAYLRKKLERVRRREFRRYNPVAWLLDCLLPRDYRRVSIESMTRGRVLVVGCAGGVETLGLGAVGVDIDRQALGIANDLRRHAETARASFAAASGADLPFRDESFDSVLSDNVIEHLPPALIPRHLKETLRVLRPGGTYVFSTPNRMFEQPAKEGHVSLHTYREWEELATQAGFRVVLTHRRRSGALVDLDWKKKKEGIAGGRGSLGVSHQGIRTVTIVAAR